MQKVEVWNYDDLAELVDKDALADFRRRSPQPESPRAARLGSEPRHLLPGPRSHQRLL